MKKKLIVEFFKDVNDNWRFRVKARNGRIIAQSEGYRAKRSAVKTAKLLLIDAVG